MRPLQPEEETRVTKRSNADLAAEVKELRDRLNRVYALTAPTPVVSAPADDTEWGRGQVLAHIGAVIAENPALPKVESVRFNQFGDGVDIQIEDGPGWAGIAAWAAALGVDPATLYRRFQPYPLDADHEKWCEWGSAGAWHGWSLDINGDEPITDEHLREWEVRQR